MKNMLYCRGKITIYDNGGCYELGIGDIDEPENQEPLIIPHEGVDPFINNPSELERELTAINPLLPKYLKRESVEFSVLLGAFKEAKKELENPLVMK